MLVLFHTSRPGICLPYSMVYRMSVLFWGPDRCLSNSVLLVPFSLDAISQNLSKYLYGWVTQLALPKYSNLIFGITLLFHPHPSCMHLEEGALTLCVVLVSSPRSSCGLIWKKYLSCFDLTNYLNTSVKCTSTFKFEFQKLLWQRK